MALSEAPTQSPHYRIRIVGSSAIGGHFAARLARTGHQVSMLARGRTLDNLRQFGLRYHCADGQFTLPVHTAASTTELGAQDLVILALKGQSLPDVADTLAPMIDPHSTVLTVGNGLPWWYFLVPGLATPVLHLRSADPHGKLERAIALPQVLGGTVFASCHCPEPGLVVHSSGARVIVGEPTGELSARARIWAGVFAEAGLGGQASTHIRRDIWIKLLGNACFNPMSLLTQTSTDQLLADPALEQLVMRLMRECISLSYAFGLDLQLDPVQRVAHTRQLGAIKTSMLQDLEAGRSVELDPILGTLLECADAIGHPMPHLASLHALACGRARQAGLYPVR